MKRTLKIFIGVWLFMAVIFAVVVVGGGWMAFNFLELLRPIVGRVGALFAYSVVCSAIVAALITWAEARDSDEGRKP